MSTGTLFIISAPSGAGKTSLICALAERDPSTTVSVSHTTRPMRPGEKDGVDYHFISLDTFLHMRDNEAFLEHAWVFDNYYGTTKTSVEASLEQGKNVILEIDWQGARQVRDQMPDAVGIFILPPSRQALEERLTHRGQDGQQVIDRRMKDAIGEISHFNEYHYLIINDDFNTALNDIATIFSSLRLQTSRQDALHDNLIRELLAGQ